MWMGLFLILVAVPLLELALLIKLGQTIGVWATFAVIFLTAGIGIMIMNAQGFAAMRRASENLRAGQPPVEPALDGFMLMIAGGLLIAPGLITDAAGLVLLIPPIRRAVAGWAMRRLTASGNVHVSTWRSDDVRPRPEPMNARPRRNTQNGSSTVIEGEFERIDEKTHDPQRSSRKPSQPE